MLFLFLLYDLTFLRL